MRKSPTALDPHAAALAAEAIARSIKEASVAVAPDELQKNLLYLQILLLDLLSWKRVTAV